MADTDNAKIPQEQWALAIASFEQHLVRKIGEGDIEAMKFFLGERRYAEMQMARMRAQAASPPAGEMNNC